MQSNQEFFHTIYQFYSNRVEEQLPELFLKELSEEITNYYYRQYSKYRLAYPKSVKRYSTFKLEDLDHPEVTDLVIKYFKNKIGDDYQRLTLIFQNISLDDLKYHEEYRENYNNK
jgi:hypothetical protein